MRLAIFGKEPSKEDLVYIQELFSQIEQEKNTLFLYDKFFEKIKKSIELKKDFFVFSKREEIKDKVDIMLSLGGDGTLLDTRPFVVDTNIAVLGINLGHLGFLTTVGRKEIKNLIKEIENKNYHIETRPLLKAFYKENPQEVIGYAINEVCFRTKGVEGMVDIDVFVDDKYLTTYTSDGLLVATPTGSTAYSLSCGGPIITPNARCLCLTPIAPHTLTLRPIIIPQEAKVEANIKKDIKEMVMILDSQQIDLSYSNNIIVSTSSYKLNLIRMNNQDFFSAIRNKLMWGTNIKNKQ